jgi:predicted lipid-binding transport protein (Tim44 family)
LTEQAPEQGTDLPTIVDADLDRSLAALATKDPAFSQAALAQRIRLIFETLQVAWSTREWLKARPYLSDRLFQSQLYWIEAYKHAHLRNLNEQTVITRSQLARVTSDKHFDGVTVRIYAQGLDYTVDDNDKVICGSKSAPRTYSEYWTLIRGANVRGAPRAEPTCPACGAPVDVNMAGNCSHCKARVTLGEFDWVLSRIEQDEVYGG